MNIFIIKCNFHNPFLSERVTIFLS
uniref:Uncharacterized protein n=1 Tax=Heterorhabditis bacteriophora TaxID=37862 RepID=A0A1I7WHL3_HETBA